VKLADSFGAKWYLVESKEQFGEVLRKWLEYDGVSLVVTPFEYPVGIS
jgi:thiamine pyrophosphate-dependent acetolactate synthase large subunit-like protein